MKKQFQNTMINAFSVLEAIIGMVVVAVVIGLVYVLFSMISERMIDFRNQNLFISDINRFSYSINKDIFESDVLIKSNDEFIFKSLSSSEITYIVSEKYALRKQNTFVDTFYFSIPDIKIDTIKDIRRECVFQRLDLNINNGKERIRFKFFKRVYPNQLIEKEFEHEN